jgi:hypothetical protein
MAAPLGFKTFATGDVLTAADTNGYLMQGVWTFANAAARDAAVTSPQEGNVCYLKDTDAVMTYSGSAWVAVGGGTGRGLMAYVTSTTSVAASASSETVALTTPSFTAVAGRLYKITYFEPQLPLTQNSNPTNTRIRLTNASGTLYATGVGSNASATAGFVENSCLTTLTTLTAGSTVIVGTVFFTGLGQTATRGGGQPAILVVEDIGLA